MNYRFVTLILTVSKLLKNCAKIRPTEHLSTNNFFNN